MSKSVIISVNFFVERVNNANNFKIKANILDYSQLDLIIGRSTIKKYGLVRQISSQFEDISKLMSEGKTPEHVNKRYGCQSKEDLLPSRSIPKGQPLTFPLKVPTVIQTSQVLASLVLEFEQLSRAPLYEDDDIDHDKNDTFRPWSTTSSDADILYLIHFSGDEDLQSRLRTLCTEFADIFSNDLPKDPADNKGVDNDIADSLSRLRRNNTIDSPKEYSLQCILSALHIESYKPSPSQY